MSTAEKCKELSQKKVKDDVTTRERRSSSLTRKSNNVNGVQGKPPKSSRTTGKAAKEPKNLKVGIKYFHIPYFLYLFPGVED